MGIRVKRLPELGLTLNVWSGAITREDLIDHYGSLTPADGGRRIAFLDPTVDLSSVGVAAIPELKRVVTSKFKEIYGDRPVLSAMVCGAGPNRPLLDFWLRYTGGEGEASMSGPLVFESMQAACDWLGLPDEACKLVNAAVDSLGG